MDWKSLSLAAAIFIIVLFSPAIVSADSCEATIASPEEVQQESSLNFELTITNNLADEQNVNIQYSVIGDRVWSQNTENVILNASSAETLQRSVFIFLAQKSRDYMLKLVASCGFDVIEKNITFKVTEKKSISKSVLDVRFVDYPEKLILANNDPEIFDVELENLGKEDLINLALTLEGLPSSWFSLKTPTVEILNQKETAIFMFRVMVPANTNEITRDIKIAAVAEQGKKEQTVELKTFMSKKALVDYRLGIINNKTSEAENTIASLGAEGKDVSSLSEELSRIKKKTDISKVYLDERDYDSALQSLKEAEIMLNSISSLPSESSSDEKTTNNLMQIIILALVLIVLIFLGFYVFTFLKNKKALSGKTETPVNEEIVKTQEELHKAVNPSKSKTVDINRDEAGKIEKVLSILEKQYNDKIISEDAYSELKKVNEEKLAKLKENA